MENESSSSMSSAPQSPKAETEQEEQKSQQPDSASPADESETKNLETKPNPTPVEPQIDYKELYEEAKKQSLYERAEMENFKKRLLKEQEKSIQFSNEKIILELLSVLNDFERAITHSQQLKEHKEPAVTNFIQGIDMTYRQLLQMLNRFNVEIIGTIGEKFDPNLHEALSQQKVPKEKDNLIVQILQKGCRMHGRLIQPARVVVGKNE